MTIDQKEQMMVADKVVLSSQALDFVLDLQRQFQPQREKLLSLRQQRQALFDQGLKPDFLKETASIRAGDWKARSIPQDLLDRRVEITGPVDRKMIINALNSGAKVFMADFEDSNSPTWENCLQGQLNLIDAVNSDISYQDPQSGKSYTLNPEHAVLIVRPRGWHLDESHILYDDKPISASLFDFGLYLFHNAQTLLNRGSGPYFYLPKLESHLEAKLWNQVFDYAEQQLSLPKGSIKATVLIETITAAFEMDEIIFALKDHIVGLNCGRWDYIFSFIKKFRNDKNCVLPDRQDVTMTCHFLNSYVQLLIETCHKRGIHAMGGMAAQIPIKGDALANEKAIEKVYQDKLREVKAGHDGTWVAHPGLIPVALKAFDEFMPGSNQLQKQLQARITAGDLLEVPQGTITEKGIRGNLSVGVQYLGAWLDGNGCVPINHLMEDAATAEICRSQLWQWLHFHAKTAEGKEVTRAYIDQLLQEEFETICNTNPLKIPYNSLREAMKLFLTMITSEEFDAFLTLPAYKLLEKGV